MSTASVQANGKQSAALRHTDLAQDVRPLHVVPLAFKRHVVPRSSGRLMAVSVSSVLPPDRLITLQTAPTRPQAAGLDEHPGARLPARVGALGERSSRSARGAGSSAPARAQHIHIGGDRRAPPLQRADELRQVLPAAHRDHATGVSAGASPAAPLTGRCHQELAAYRPASRGSSFFR